jgi:two-component system, NtrC family, response regulator GlrR
MARSVEPARSNVAWEPKQDFEIPAQQSVHQENSSLPAVFICAVGSCQDAARCICKSLGAEPFKVTVATEEFSNKSALEFAGALERTHARLVFLVFSAAERRAALAMMPILNRAESHPKTVAVTDSREVEELASLFANGFEDYLMLPLCEPDVICRTRQWLGVAVTPMEVARNVRQKFGIKGLIGESPILIAELQKLPKFARTDACVLILGETGTGKELCARAVHHLSGRNEKPFVALNTGAIPADLIENELFGHDAGAYTSARGPQSGLIHAADGGTLFLDEIDTLPLSAQVKLLRFLQEKEYRPLGARRSVSANVRVIAASNLNLAKAAADGRFRKDLFYRINVLPLTLPSLRERREDIPQLARHFIAKHNSGRDDRQLELSLDAARKLQWHDWPGNVRELENVIQRALALCEGAKIQAGDIDLPGEEPPRAASVSGGTFKTVKAQLVGRFERDYLEGILQRHHGNISHAAREAGKNRRAFFALLQKYKLNARGFHVIEPESRLP